MRNLNGTAQGLGHRAADRAARSVGFAIVFLIAACGGSPKQADDPSAQTKSDDSAPKWDSSSSTSGSSSSGSSDSSATSDSSSGSGASSGSSTASSGSTGSSGGAGDATATKAGPNNEAEVALKRAARQVKANCGAAKDTDGKATGPFGKTTVNIVLGRNGHSKNVTLDPSFDGKPAGKCMIQAFTNLTYAPWAGADMNVQWEAELVHPK